MQSFKRQIFQSSQGSLLLLYNFYYQAIHPEAHAGSDYIVYIDAYGNQQTHTLTRDDVNGNPCELIEANSVIQITGAFQCNI